MGIIRAKGLNVRRRQWIFWCVTRISVFLVQLSEGGILCTRN
jgi:hypothetical protein